MEDIREPGENHWRDILREQDSDFISTDCTGICKSNYSLFGDSENRENNS